MRQERRYSDGPPVIIPLLSNRFLGGEGRGKGQVSMVTKMEEGCCRSEDSCMAEEGVCATTQRHVIRGTIAGYHKIDMFQARRD